MFIRVYHLIVKELLASLRDPKARAVLIVPPLLQIFILSFAITQEVKNVSLGVLNLDSGTSGYELVQRFENSHTFTKIVTLERHADIAPALDRQRVLAVIVIPQDFSRETLAGRTPQVQVLMDGRKTNAAPIVGGYATKIIQQFFAENARSVPEIKGVQVETLNRYNVNLDPRKTTVPSLVCILAGILGMTLSGLSIARERETGTFEQLLVSPLTPFEIMLGKTIPTVILAAGSAIMLIGITVFVLGIPLVGSFWLLLGSMLLFLLSAVGIGLFISSLSMTQQQAILGVILVLPASIMLSGFATPVENMPDWMQSVTVVNPVRWYLVIVKGVFMKGMGADEVLQNCIPLAILSVITLSAAGAMFRRRME